jgi:serine/threonine protein kinase
MPSGEAHRDPNDQKTALAPDPTAAYATTPFAAHLNSDTDRTVVQQLSDYVSQHARKAVPLAKGYKLLRPLGEGTFGTVWLAEDRAGVKVAIKFFAHGAGREWQQLQDEVRTLAQLETTAGIIPLKEVEPEADPPYFVMGYAEGGSLAQKIESGAIPVKEAFRYFRHIAEALAFVHAKGIRHCDLKPANILLNQHGQPLIADFGQAHLSDDATPSLGTFYYMAPEQAELDSSIPDTRWDVYSMGALLYAMLTGQPPRRDAQLSEELKRTVQLHHRLKIYRDRIRSMPTPTAHGKMPGMDRMLTQIVDRCLELNPAKRFRDAGAVIDALETRKRQRRQRPLLALGAVFSLAALGLLAAAGAWFARSATADAATSLRVQQLHSNQVAAQLAANVLEEKFKDRIGFLESLVSADSAQLARWIDTGSVARKASEGANVPPELKPLRDWLLTSYLSQYDASKSRSRYFSALVVIDAQGFVLARAGMVRDETKPRIAPSSIEERKDNYDRSYTWRNWFNGERDYFEEENEPKPRKPIGRPNISEPYVGVKFTKGQTSINITVPVIHDDRVVGLLMGNLKWNDFQRWLEEVQFPGGFAAVVNHLGQCLGHKESDLVRPQPRERAPTYFANAPLARDKLQQYSEFSDPVNGRIYLAASAPFQPIPEQTWVVVVEHELAAALAPVIELQNRLRRVGLWCLGIMALMIGGMWSGLIWTLRREERSAHG